MLDLAMVGADLVLEAVGEPNRRRLLELLHQRDEATVSELAGASGLNQPQVSKHLKVLASAMLVAVRVNGRRRHYRLDGTGLKAAHDWFASFDDVWQSRFDARRASTRIELADDGLSYQCVRTFGAQPARVFQAFTDPADLRVWFPSGAPDGSELIVCESDPAGDGYTRMTMQVNLPDPEDPETFMEQSAAGLSTSLGAMDELVSA